jgi:hypothetical protein
MNEPIMYREQKAMLDSRMRQLRSEVVMLEEVAQITTNPVEEVLCYERIKEIVKEMDKISDHLYYLRIAQPI